MQLSSGFFRAHRESDHPKHTDQTARATVLLGNQNLFAHIQSCAVLTQITSAESVRKLPSMAQKMSAAVEEDIIMKNRYLTHLLQPHNAVKHAQAQKQCPKK